MVKHLPPSIKQLLTLRNPNVLPSPPLSQLHALFADTRRDARGRTPNVEKGWLVLTTCTLLTVNRPSALGHLYRFITRSDSGDESSRCSVLEATSKAAVMRESALKSVIFVGVPRTILSLTALRESFEDDVKTSLRQNPIRQATPENIENTLTRGRALWDSIYEPHADKLHDKLGALHPDFIKFIMQSYGSVLAPLPAGADDTGNLSRALGSVVGMATLRAEGGVGPQLTSHTFGLLKARNEPAESLSDEDRWLASDEGTEWVLRTVDRIIDGVGAADGQDGAGRNIGAKL